MAVTGPGEFDLIKKLIAYRRPRNAEVLVDAGDDAAAVLLQGGDCMLFTCDTQVQGVHFSDSIPASALGRRLAAVNLSDIAAMGGQPRWALVSLLLPTEGWMASTDELYQGICEELALYDADIIGGNVSATSGPLTMELFLVGQVSPTQILRRSGAKVGEILCVTGNPGDSTAGRILLSRSDISVESSVSSKLIHKHWMPSPRLAAGQYLARTGHVSACVDISDGLWQDAGHLAESSHVSLMLYVDQLPLSPEAKRAAQACGEHAVTWALTGGEDYELLFTVRENRVESVLRGLQDETDTRATAIGEVGPPGDSVVVMEPDGSQRRDIRTGFDHLAMPSTESKRS